ncbi:MAG TPA: DUF2339 domain-containing protein [Parafilimonas sp.]|nr:DUF2339 domain-containing protein [Parafilimonas sp.]
MSTPEEIKELQQRLDQLSRELEGYRQQLFTLRQQVNHLNGNATPGQPNAPKQIGTSKRNAGVTSASRQTALENFIGLRVIHVVGIVVLLIGISIGVKYAIDQNLITPLSRIILAYMASAGLFILSVILRKNYEGFSAILFSGAMASAYFTTYGAFVYYDLFPQTFAFVIMAGLAVYTAIKSIQYNRQEIALLGMVGAYAIPLLVSSNHENYVLLFSYVLVMNAGILYVSFRRSWKVMNLLALFITWTIFTGWLLFKYKPAYKFYAIIFTAAYYISFLLSAFAFRIRKHIRLSQRQLLHLLLNNFAFFISLLSIFEASSSNARAAAITGFCAILFFAFALAGNNFFHDEKMLNRMHYVESLILAVLFVAIEWSGLNITLLWTLISVIVFVLGIITKTTWPRLASIVLLALTLLKLMIIDSLSFTAVQKIIAYLTIGTLLLVISFFYQKFRQMLFENAENEKI